ncbi:hypothetical protein [Lacinutrix mariniflava]|uniref:hypothetical protein n=1 Tax=Lacinutrix mariniflava TaxID=342955 RepID=UPI00128EF067|nr:hypothetical protein [Lacinutrix mariniflava]
MKFIKLTLLLTFCLTVFNSCTSDNSFIENEQLLDKKLQENNAYKSTEGDGPIDSGVNINTLAVNYLVTYEPETSKRQKDIVRNNWSYCLGLLYYTSISESTEIWHLDPNIYYDLSITCTTPQPGIPPTGKDTAVNGDPDISITNPEYQPPHNYTNDN